MDCTIRTMRSDEIELAIEFAALEGWNPGLHDAACFHAADPPGFLVAECLGQAVGCISAVSYAGRFGFIGLYIVAPAWRGQGIGHRLWAEGMARLAGQVVGLDGVPAQQGNYRKSGFRLAWNNVRYEGAPVQAEPPTGVSLVDARSIGFDRLAAYDRRFFPEARDSFLASWISQPERVAMVALRDGAVAGFGVMRNCQAGARIGPLHAETPDIASALFSAAAATLGATAVAVDIAGVNKAAVSWAEGLGLKPSFETARMYTGPDPAIDAAGLYGVASFELG